MSTLPAALLGIAAALAAPWYLEAPRLKRLLAGSPPAGQQGDPRRAARWANRTLALLARLPRAPWKNTCLYRAVAECLALRWLGWEAVLRIGARRAAADGKVLAHAWVDGFAAVPSGEGYQVFSARSPTGS